MQRRLRHSLILVLFAVLFLPMAQQLGGWMEERPLEGISRTHLKPQFRFSNWLEGTYQDSLFDYASQNCGFHHSLIRLNNQFYYSVYNTAQANTVIIGQENCLYDRAHIDAYTGADFLGDSAIHSRMRQLIDLQQILKTKGIRMMLVIVPGKATGLPEFLPAGTPKAGEITNYKRYKQLADSLGFPCLDLIAWYQQQKATSEYPLYPSGGIHWSQYCATLAADTLFGFIDQLMDTTLNRFEVTEVDWPVPAKGEDNDINRGMNLLFPLPAPPMAYPKIQWKGLPPRLKVLSVADSYYFKAFTSFTLPVFETSHLWFYFNELHICGQDKITMTEDVDFLKEVESQNLIMLYTSDRNLTNLGFGFIERAMELYHDDNWREKEIERISMDIRQDANWMQQIREKAVQNGVPVDSMLRRDAIWVIENAR